jgi:5-methylcytosine-specific restriction endonuclease McrA
VVEEDEAELRSERISFNRPAVIRLVVYVKLPRDNRRRVTRRAVFARDGWECQYCGGDGNLTVDHVVPRSRGGEHEWTNVVTACIPCNQRKGDCEPKQAGMKSQYPSVPPSSLFVYIAVKKPPSSWRGYLVA